MEANTREKRFEKPNVFFVLEVCVISIKCEIFELEMLFSSLMWIVSLLYCYIINNVYSIDCEGGVYDTLLKF